MSSSDRPVQHRIRPLTLAASFLCALGVVFVVHSLRFPGSVPDFSEASGGGLLLDTRPTFDPELVQQRIESYGEAGRANYRFRLWTVDVLLPLSLTVFLVLWMRRALQAVEARPFVATALLAVAGSYMAFDLAENAALFTLLSIHPTRCSVLPSLLPYLSSIKRAGLVAALLVPALVLVSVSLRRRLRRGSSAGLKA